MVLTRGYGLGIFMAIWHHQLACSLAHSKARAACTSTWGGRLPWLEFLGLLAQMMLETKLGPPVERLE